MSYTPAFGHWCVLARQVAVRWLGCEPEALPEDARAAFVASADPGRCRPAREGVPASFLDGHSALGGLPAPWDPWKAKGLALRLGPRLALTDGPMFGILAGRDPRENRKT